ncbi:MAG: hypothetical protein U0441_20585 [Polyangiaceae bacterium]
MRTEVRMLFDVTSVPGGAWTFLREAGCGADVAKLEEYPPLDDMDAVVTLEVDDPRIAALKSLLQRQGMTWFEWCQDRYTDTELSSARLLLLGQNGGVDINGGVEWGTTFDLAEACPVCATGCRQSSALFIDGEQVPKLEGHRVARTHFWHLLVDDAVAAALEDASLTGLRLRSVYAVMPDKRQVKLRWKQLDSDNVLGPMALSTTGIERREQSEQLRPCEACRRNGFLTPRLAPTRAVYRASALAGALDVNSTWENYWCAIVDREDFRRSVLSRPWTVVTPKVYRIFRDASVTELELYPIRIEED